MCKNFKDLARKLEKIEVFLEDIVIAFLAIFSILIILASFDVIANLGQLKQSLNAVLSTFGIKIVSFGAFTISLLGYLVLPWLLLLALFIIARDLWILRRMLEKAVSLEVKIEREVEKVEKELKEEKK